MEVFRMNSCQKKVLSLGLLFLSLLSAPAFGMLHKSPSESDFKTRKELESKIEALSQLFLLRDVKKIKLDEKRARESGIDIIPVFPDQDESISPAQDFLDDDTHIKPTLDSLYLNASDRKEIEQIISALKRSCCRSYDDHSLLLHGAAGVGKSTLAKIIAHESGYALIEESASDIVTKFQGSGPEHIKKLFKYAWRLKRPVVVFIDEIDKIASIKKDDTRDYENATASLWKSLDISKNEYPHVFVIFATNNFDSLDERVTQRCDEIIKIQLPDKEQRKAIINHYAHVHKKIIPEKLCRSYIRCTTGWSGRELKRMIIKACKHSGSKAESDPDIIAIDILAKDDLYRGWLKGKDSKPKSTDFKPKTGFRKVLEDHPVTTGFAGICLGVAGTVTTMLYQKRLQAEQMAQTFDLHTEQMAQTRALHKEQIANSNLHSYIGNAISAVSAIATIVLIVINR